MVVSLEEAITILSKWKDDSATILVAAKVLFDCISAASMIPELIGRWVFGDV